MTVTEPRTLTARWVFPVAGPPLERGTVTVRGPLIEAVEPHGTHTPDDDLGNAAIIPGLVNAHTHLDLSGARSLIPPTDPDHFCDWLRGVIAYRRSRTPEQTQADIRAGLDECMQAGTTLIGDIAGGGISWDSLSETALRAVVFRELIGLTFSAQDAYFSTAHWISNHSQTATCRPGISPHAPYSVRAFLFAASSALCRDKQLPSAIHFGESPAEFALLEHRQGPFVQFLSDLGITELDGLGTIETALCPFEMMNHSRLFIHCNYLDPNAAFPPGATIVYCPRTHAAFRHPPHSFRDFLARGVRVCLGTDSLASNPDLDILAEARFVHTRYPDFPGDALLKMVTLSGAEALGWADEVGSLEPGKSADLVAVPLPNRAVADPHELLFAADAPIEARRTMFRGMWR